MGDPFDPGEGQGADRTTTPDGPSRGSTDGVGRRLRGRGRRYRVGIVAFAGLGVVMGVAGLAVGNGREVLFALSGIGLFGAVLWYLLVPERFVPASLGWRTYAPLAEVGPLFATVLDLPDRRVYRPTDDGRVRLLLSGDDEGPDGREGRPVGVHETEGVREAVLPTTGDELLAAFRERHDEALRSDAEELVDQLLDVLVEEFELVGRANARVEPAGRAVVTVERSYYGPPTTFDHPVAAFLAAGLAAGLGTAVVLAHPRRTDDGRYVVTCRWDR